ncbi:MAG: hypothetical protein JXP34_16590 [Planctomycetes bacterium]|nr:hypothetical protein [Planctomycetota bacterium]
MHRTDMRQECKARAIVRPLRRRTAGILGVLAAGCAAGPHLLAPGEGPEPGRAVAVYAIHVHGGGGRGEGEVPGEGGECADVRAWRGYPIILPLQSETFHHGGRASLEGEPGAPVAFSFSPGRFVLALEEVNGAPVGGGVRSVSVSDRPALIYLGDIHILQVGEVIVRDEDAASEPLRADPSPIGSTRVATRSLRTILEFAIVDDARGMEERIRDERPELWKAFEALENRAHSWVRGGSRGWSIEFGKARPLEVRSSLPPWAMGTPPANP